MATATSFLNQPETRAFGLPLLLVLASLLLSGLFAYPTFTDIQALRDDITAEQDRIEILEEKSNTLLDFADQEDALNEQFAFFETAVTQESKIPELLTKVQALSDECGLSVQSLTYGGESGEAETGQQVRVQYSATGAFSGVSCLVSAFEASARLLDVESFQYSSAEDEFGVLELTPDATIIAYFLPTPVLVADSPITFSFSDPAYLQILDYLETLQ